MQDQQYRITGSRVPGRAGARTEEDETVVDFASWVVALLAAGKSVAETVMRPELLTGLIGAAICDDIERLDVFLRDLVRQKVSAAAMADLYIPAAARELGVQWHDDKITFAEVSLATARLQSMLRAIGSAWVADVAQPRQSGTILLAVPPKEQHTLGAMVLLGQLRRLGVSVRLMIGPDRHELKKAMETLRFDGVLVSACSAVRLAELKVFVETIRHAGPAGLPVVVGGGLLQLVDDAKARTGADAIAHDLAGALDACGLGCNINGAEQRA